MANDVELEMIE